MVNKDYQWYTVPIVKNTQNHWCTNRYRSTKTVPTVDQRCTNRQKQSKDSQNSKNDHWCTNRHRSTKTVPIQCNNSLPIVNKNVAIANRSRVSCAHNTSREIIGLNITP